MRTCASSLFDTGAKLQAFSASRGRSYRSLNAVQAHTIFLRYCCRFASRRIGKTSNVFRTTDTRCSDK